MGKSQKDVLEELQGQSLLFNNTDAKFSIPFDNYEDLERRLQHLKEAAKTDNIKFKASLDKAGIKYHEISEGVSCIVEYSKEAVEISKSRDTTFVDFYRKKTGVIENKK